MADILKRPMFRKGGSTSDGVGITSGLTSRQNYQVGGAGIIPVIEEQYQEMRPKRSENIGNFIMALGATAPEDPTKLQTFGQVFSKAGAATSAMREAKEAEARKFKAGATQKLIENLSQPERDQLIRRAKEYARLNNIPEDQAINMFLKQAYGKSGEGYLKYYSPEVRVERLTETYTDEDGLGFSEGGARRVAKAVVAFRDEKLPDAIQAKFQGPIDQEGSLIAGEQEGVFEFRDLDNIDDIYYIPNKIYVNPDDGDLYEYIGEGQFKKANL
jgi:hypothetical protein